MTWASSPADLQRARDLGRRLGHRDEGAQRPHRRARERRLRRVDVVRAVLGVHHARHEGAARGQRAVHQGAGVVRVHDIGPQARAKRLAIRTKSPASSPPREGRRRPRCRRTAVRSPSRSSPPRVRRAPWLCSSRDRFRMNLSCPPMFSDQTTCTMRIDGSPRSLAEHAHPRDHADLAEQRRASQLAVQPSAVQVPGREVRPQVLSAIAYVPGAGLLARMENPPRPALLHRLPPKEIIGGIETHYMRQLLHAEGGRARRRAPLPRVVGAAPEAPRRRRRDPRDVGLSRRMRRDSRSARCRQAVRGEGARRRT